MIYSGVYLFFKPLFMAGFDVIGKLMKRYRFKLTFTYTLFCLEMLGSLLRPYFLGVAVNDLIKGSYQGVVVLSIVHLAWLIIGTARHMYDTRTYSGIYASLVTRFLSRRIARSDISKLSAHSTLSRELVDFLESDLPYIIEALYNIIGSLIILYFYNSKVVLVCFIILIPVMIISYIYGKKMSRLTRLKNDELEKQVSIIAVGNDASIKKHYSTLRKWQIKISDKEAINFGLIELMVLFVIGSSLIISSNLFGVTMLAGNLIGIYNYILKFVSGLDTIPYSVQKISSLKDIIRRIEFQKDDISAYPFQKEKNIYIQGKLKLSA